jgi:hypothetical protein
LSEVKVSGNYTAVAVQTAKIDDLGSADIGFIKIDVEGFESAVLRGARQTIARDRPTIFFEIEEQHTKRPIEQSLREVLALGYRGLFCSEGYSAPCSSSTRRGTLEPAMASTCSTSSSYLKPEIVQPW